MSDALVYICSHCFEEFEKEPKKCWNCGSDEISNVFESDLEEYKFG